MHGEEIPVVILCGGRGTRLREGSGTLPKPLVEVGNRPILWHIMKAYAHAGFKRFILCLGYKGQSIKEYFVNYDMMHSDLTVEFGARDRRVQIEQVHQEDDWKVSLVDTGRDAMTGARVKRVQDFVGDRTFMLTYGDGVTDLDIQSLLAFHRRHGKICSVTGVHPPSRFGEFILEGDRAIRFSEKPQVQHGFINGGFFVCEPRFFDYLSEDDSCVLERSPLERLAADQELMVHRHEGFWQCMDTYRDLMLLNDMWEKDQAPWRVWDRHRGPAK